MTQRDSTAHSGIPGQRNEPARLAEIFTCMAALRPKPTADVARLTTANAERLFSLPPDMA